MPFSDCILKIDVSSCIIQHGVSGPALVSQLASHKYRKGWSSAGVIGAGRAPGAEVRGWFGANPGDGSAFPGDFVHLAHLHLVEDFAGEFPQIHHGDGFCLAGQDLCFG